MFQEYFSSIKELQEQTFRVMAALVWIANLFGSLLNAVLYGTGFPTNMCFICGMVISFFIIYGFSTHRKERAAVGILLTVVWIEFPSLFLVYGNVILVYFVLSIIGIIIYFPRKFSVAFCGLTIGMDVFVVIFHYFFPMQTETKNEMVLMLFTVCSYVIVALSVVIILVDIIVRYEKQKEELRKKQHELEYLADHDPLTKLYNRGYFIRQIETRIKDEDSDFIIVIMDIDDFKRINDTYGHAFGDDVLITFAQIMEYEVRGHGFVARYGGEEFIIIFDYDNQERVMQIMKNISSKLIEHYRKEKNILVTFSGGLVQKNGAIKTDELIIRADNKLYQAKGNGKNQIVC